MRDRRCAAAVIPQAKLTEAPPIAAGTVLLFMLAFPFGETETITKSSSPSESSERRTGAAILLCALVGELNQVVGLGKAERWRLILLLPVSMPAQPAGFAVAADDLLELVSDEVLLLPIGSGSLLLRDQEEEEVDWDGPDMTRRVCCFERCLLTELESLPAGYLERGISMKTAGIAVSDVQE